MYNVKFNGIYSYKSNSGKLIIYFSTHFQS